MIGYIMYIKPMKLKLTLQNYNYIIIADEVRIKKKTNKNTTNYLKITWVVPQLGEEKEGVVEYSVKDERWIM